MLFMKIFFNFEDIILRVHAHGTLQLCSFHSFSKSILFGLVFVVGLGVSYS
jgi:hypothetical protein